jgi:hypothetical protein
MPSNPPQSLTATVFALLGLLAIPVLASAQTGANKAAAKDGSKSTEAAAAAKTASEKAAAEVPVYPRVDYVTSYSVDPDWPQKPASVAWGQMPGVAVDPKDNVWIFTRAEPPIQVYSPEGKLVKSWGTGVVKTAHQIKLDADGNVWLADVGLHTVSKFTQDGKLLLTLGTPEQRGEDETHMWMPTDMAFAKNGDILVADGYGNARVVRFDKTGRFLKAWGTLGGGPRQFSIPHAIAIDSKDRVFVADRNNARVQVYSPEGELLDSWTNLLVPWGFCIDKNDDVWVCGSSPMLWTRDEKYPKAPLGCPPKDQLFMRFNSGGKLLQLWTQPKGEDGKEKPGELNWVHGIALDSKGNVYLGDIIGQRLQKFIRHEGAR